MKLRRIGKRFTMMGLGLVEQMILPDVPAVSQPQLFILGLPRSGTTLLYQYIVHRLQFAYFTNKAGNYYTSTYLATYLQRNQLGYYQSDFQSEYGKVKGDLSPREAGSFWGQFFSLEEYASFDQLSPQKVAQLQRTIGGVQTLFGGLPFVNKNVKHMLRLEALSKIFPNSYFLVIERDLSEVALSVLRGRYQSLADPMQWWSVKPPNYEMLKDLPIAEQICGQLVALQKQMAVDFSKIASNRVHYLHYSEFCNEPEAIITYLKHLLGDVPYRNPAVDSFTPSQKIPQTEEEHRLIELIKS